MFSKLHKEFKITENMSFQIILLQKCKKKCTMCNCLCVTYGVSFLQVLTRVLLYG